MYKVENINETNTFVVKKDNSVKRCIRQYGDQEEYLPAGALINVPYYLRGEEPITDEMMSNQKARGARKQYHLYTFPFTRTDRDKLWSHEMPDTAKVMPCQLRRATKEEVELCKQYAAEFNGLIQKQLDEWTRLNEERERERKAEEEKKQAALRKFKRSPKGIWVTIVNKVSRKLACELVMLAGKFNKKHIETSEVLQDEFGVMKHLNNDLFEKLYHISVEEYDRRYKEICKKELPYNEMLKEFDELNMRIFGSTHPKYNRCCRDAIYDALGVW